MSGIADEDEFDEMVDQMRVDDVVSRNLDELRPVQEALHVFELAASLKELWILGDRFHPMGKWADELPSLVIQWVQAVRTGDDRRLFLRQDRTFVDADPAPPWSSPNRLFAAAPLSDAPGLDAPPIRLHRRDQGPSHRMHDQFCKKTLRPLGGRLRSLAANRSHASDRRRRP